MKPTLSAVLVLCAVSLARPAQSHTFQPFLLDVQETAPGTFNVAWKVPTTSVDQRAPLSSDATPQFADHCSGGGATDSVRVERGVLHSWSITCGEAGLWGSEIRVAGLEGSPVDVLVRITWLDSREFVEMLRSNDPSVSVPSMAQRNQPLRVLRTYIGLGIEHIASGIDHLFFVLGLLMLVVGVRRLFWTVTAFTLAHSVTLALSVLGLANLPSAPVEAIIAMSIVLVASESLRREATLSRRYPQLIGFAFGLIHGLGFAGALREIGLPQDGVWRALLGFNLGVELGQLAFIGVVVGVAVCIRRAMSEAKSARLLSGLGLAGAYAIGSVACFWVFERISAFL